MGTCAKAAQMRARAARGGGVSTGEQRWKPRLFAAGIHAIACSAFLIWPVYTSARVCVCVCVCINNVSGGY